MQEGKCDIGTLASKFSSENEKADINNVKVVVKNKLSSGHFIEAIDFFRSDSKKKENIYHHVGIYGFRAEILKLWFSLPNSKLEKTEQLEQLKVLESGYKISTFKIEGNSLSVDTIEQLEEARKIARNNASSPPFPFP